MWNELLLLLLLVLSSSLTRTKGCARVSSILLAFFSLLLPYRLSGYYWAPGEGVREK